MYKVGECMAYNDLGFREFDLDRIIRAVNNEKNEYNWFQRAYDNFAYSLRGVVAGGLRSATGFIVTALALNYVIPVSEPVGIAFGVGVASSIVPPVVNTKLNKHRSINYHHILSAIRYFKEDLQASKTVMKKLEKSLINVVEKERKKGIDLSEEKLDLMQRFAGCLGDSVKKFDAKLLELNEQYDESVCEKGLKKKHKKMHDIIKYISGIRDHIDDLYDDACYVCNVISGEYTYDPDYTRGNKLFQYMDEELYDEQLREYISQGKDVITNYDFDRYDGKTAERNI